MPLRVVRRGQEAWGLWTFFRQVQGKKKSHHRPVQAGPELETEEAVCSQRKPWLLSSSSSVHRNLRHMHPLSFRSHLTASFDFLTPGPYGRIYALSASCSLVLS